MPTREKKPRPIPSVEVLPMEGEMRIWSVIIRLTGELAHHGVPLVPTDGMIAGHVGVKKDGTPVHVSILFPEKPWGHIPAPRPKRKGRG